MILVMRFEFDDHARRCLRAYYGHTGLATRSDLRRFILGTIWEQVNDVVHDAENAWEHENDERGD